MSSIASVLCLKLHSDSETIRVRVDPEQCQTYEQLCGFVEKAWRELQFRDYRLFYLDNVGEMCLLNDLSLPDALAVADARGKISNTVPVLDIYVDVKGGEQPSFTPLDPTALMVADLLDDLDYVTDPFAALRLVDSLAAADQDMAKVADSLKAKKEQKAEKKEEKAVVDKKEEPSVEKENDAAQKQVATSQEKPEVSVSCEKAVQQSGSEPKVMHMEKEVSSEKEAKDAMADFLNKSGFVSDKKSGEELVNNMFDNLSSMQKVADRLMGYEKADAKKDTKEVEDETKELQNVQADPLARNFVDMLSDFGFIQNKAAARELVSALMATQADLDDLSKRLSSSSTVQKSLSQ
ncbi:hypothetical protein FOL47_003684 [Perkinsus chesapeaki]|uniref:Uncharacterized protein n=1 Tax=Perkinsus chesapeaki TaxID=330153 RepID=A0A7J6M6T3_PERCH|nr:hypothetical protein FOL47_003684 [Perkinsus chesapeaki]